MAPTLLKGGLEHVDLMDVERPVNAVFAGGGMKGIALGGAAAAAMDSGYRFEQLVGTSSGAMIASLLAAGYSADELKEAVAEIPWPQLADPIGWTRIPLLGRHIALTFGMGHHRGQVLERTWRALLREKDVRRFGDLGTGKLRIIATDLTHQRGVVMPDDLSDYGVPGERFSVARAVHMSTAVPFFFRPVPLRNLRGGRTSLFADGALTSNFPLRLVDWQERPVLGFTFNEAPFQQPPSRLRGPASLVRAVITASVRASGTVRGALMERATLIEIPIDHDPLDFDISPSAARSLFDEGYHAAKEAIAASPVEQASASSRPGPA